MILLIVVLVILSGVSLWQRLEIINFKYRQSIIEHNVDKMIKQAIREHNGMVSYDLLLKRLNEIKSHIKYGK